MKPEVQGCCDRPYYDKQRLEQRAPSARMNTTGVSQESPPGGLAFDRPSSGDGYRQLEGKSRPGERSDLRRQLSTGLERHHASSVASIVAQDGRASCHHVGRVVLSNITDNVAAGHRRLNVDILHNVPPKHPRS
jgi:hypothetical protein